jgi:DNA-binding transcriptional regulator of glucitol operon
MHILFGLLAILGGLAFWWYRMKNVAEATSEMTDAAGRAWGKYKRYRFSKKAESSPVEAVEDPVAAATVMMIAMVKEENELTPAAEEAIRNEAVSVMKIDDPEELMVFAKWVANHVQDANSVSLRYAKLWASALNRDERIELVEMVERATASIAPLTRNQEVKLGKLRERLGLMN